MVKEASELGGELSELSDMSDMIDVHTPCDMNFVNMGGAGNLNDAGIGELSVKARHALRASDLNEEEMAARVLACKGRDVPLGEMEKMLPSANVQRVMREVIPANGKIAQDAKDFVQICVSEFITQVTAEAHEKCKREERKAITGDDILWSINQLGFMHYTKVVRCFLQRLRAIDANDRIARRQYEERLWQNDEHKAKSQPPRLLVDTPLNCNSLAATNRPFMAANSKAKRVLELEDKSRDQSTCKKRHQI